MSSQSTLSQCENFVSVLEDPDLVASDFPVSASIYFPLSIFWKYIVKYIWWDTGGTSHIVFILRMANMIQRRCEFLYPNRARPQSRTA